MHKTHRDSSGGELGSENYDSYQIVWVPLHPFTSPYTPGLLGENSKCSDLGMFSDKDIFCLSLSRLSWTPFPFYTLSQNLNVIHVTLWHIIIIYLSVNGMASKIFKILSLYSFLLIHAHPVLLCAKTDSLPPSFHPNGISVHAALFSTFHYCTFKSHFYLPLILFFLWSLPLNSLFGNGSFLVTLAIVIQCHLPFACFAFPPVLSHSLPPSPFPSQPDGVICHFASLLLRFPKKARQSAAQDCNDGRHALHQWIREKWECKRHGYQCKHHPSWNHSRCNFDSSP